MLEDGLENGGGHLRARLLLSIPFQFTGHCEANVSKTTFYAHKKVYYDKQSKAWKQQKFVQSSDSTDSEDFLLELDTEMIESPHNSTVPANISSPNDDSATEPDNFFFCSEEVS